MHIVHINHISQNYHLLAVSECFSNLYDLLHGLAGLSLHHSFIRADFRSFFVFFSSRQIQRMVNETFFNCMQGLVWYSLAFLLQGAWKMILSCSVQWNPHRFHKDWSERLVDVWEHWHDICSCRLLCVTVVHVCREHFHLNMHDSGGPQTYLFSCTLISLLFLYFETLFVTQASRQASN